jgi:PEP-CTERM motif
MTLGYRTVGWTAVLAIFLATPAQAVLKQWNSASDGNWNVSTNWTPPGVPLTGDDVRVGTVIGTAGTRVTMDITDFVNTLQLSNGNDLSTGGFELVVNTTGGSTGTTLSGSGTTLLVKVNSSNPAFDSFDTDSLTVNSGSTVMMLGGVLEVDEANYTNNGTLRGYGTIDLEDSVAAVTSLFTNSGGTINVGNAADGFIILSDVARTLQINATDADARIDLDNGVNPTLNINRAGTFDVNVPFADAFSATLNMAANSTLDMSNSWSRNAGNLNVNTQAGFFAGQPAGTATIRGATYSQTGGSINLDNVADHLVFNATSTITGGTIDLTQGTITFNRSATIGAGVDFIINAAIAETEINVNSTVTVNDTNWNWDGAGQSTNVINIGDFGTLNANITASSDRYSGTMNINGGTLNVQGLSNTWGQDSGTITIGGTTQSVIAGDLFVKTGGSFVVDSGANLDMNNAQDWDGGSLTVNGILDLNGTTEWAGTIVNGTGRIEPGTANVTANQTINIGVYDWDTGTTTVNPGVTFTINATNIDIGNDRHDGTINVNSGTINVNVADNQWDLNGNLNLTNTGAGNPVLNGDTLRVFGNGDIVVDGGATINANLILEEGGTPGTGTDLTIVGSGGTVSLQGATTLAGGDILDTIDRSLANSTVNMNGSLTVTGVSTVNVEEFDFDQGPTTVTPDGVLTISSASIELATGAQQYDNTLTLNSGNLAMNLTGHTSWIMDLTLNMNNTASDIPRLSGDRVEIGNDVSILDANVNVGGTGRSDISAPVTFFSDADVNVNAGASLYLSGTTIFNSVNGANNAEFTGAGTLLLGGTTTFSEVTTINMPSGTVDLDGGTGDIIGNTVTVNANTVINADTMLSFGKNNFFGVNVLTLNGFARLTVNLTNPNDEWTINSPAIVNINAIGDPLIGSGISGSDVNVAGTVNVSGNSGWGARVDISGTVTTGIASDFIRFGGGSLADPNRLIGGTINGPGTIGALSNDAMVGFGTIDTTISFLGNSELRADNGTLNVNGTISDVGTIGTADTDGVLNVTNVWNTNVADAVELLGGTLQGATITNDLPAGITGFGTINAVVRNNTQISAAGGTLLVNNADWDGTTETGTLNAINGHLTITDPATTFGFDGTVNIGLNRVVFADSLNLDFNPGSSLSLAGGTYRSNVSNNFGGGLAVNGATSRLDSPGIFESTANATLNANLEIARDMTINSGTTFAGTNDLVVLSTSTLTVADGASIGVEIQNNGTLVLGASPAQATVAALTQPVGGTLEIELGGLFPGTQFDQWLVTGVADLDGTLNVSLIGGFVPALGQTFNIITAGSIVGTFSTENFPALGGGLDFQANYLATAVQLEVISSVLIGDLDGDGFVGITDLNLVLANWNLTVPPGNPLADPTGDLFVGIGDLNLVLGNWNAGTPPAEAAVPEPASLALLGLGGLAMLRRR